MCPKFQPNIFDSSRCHECLRLKHLHTHTPTHTPEQVNPVSESSSRREEKEQSPKVRKKQRIDEQRNMGIDTKGWRNSFGNWGNTVMLDRRNI